MTELNRLLNSIFDSGEVLERQYYSLFDNYRNLGLWEDIYHQEFCPHCWVKCQQLQKDKIGCCIKVIWIPSVGWGEATFLEIQICEVLPALNGSWKEYTGSLIIKSRASALPGHQQVSLFPPSFPCSTCGQLDDFHFKRIIHRFKRIL